MVCDVIVVAASTIQRVVECLMSVLVFISHRMVHVVIGGGICSGTAVITQW